MPSQGSVIARVYTSDAYLPLFNVPVVFRNFSPDGRGELLAIRMTNSSGLTEPLYVETPDVEQSLSPNSTPRPYASISISASAPGYNAISAEGVQIFPGVQTVQSLQLRPVSPPDHSLGTTVIEPPQNL